MRDLLRWVAALDGGLERHSALVAALIEAGELAQAVADAEYRRAGERDTDSAAVRASMALVMGLAVCSAESWSSNFVRVGSLPLGSVDRCASSLPSGSLEVRQPEGYAFYALYPESYFEAASSVGSCNWQVFGVRSIGTSLACMVAAGLHASQPQTLRPSGHPFDRRVIAHGVRAEANRDGYAIVDEGPGLSGSSMAALARWLLDQGIARDVVHLFPSHANGPGPKASAETRELWHTVHVHVATSDGILRDRAHLARWVENALGRLDEPLLDIGDGRWRALQQHDLGEVPPVHPWQERRKFLATANGARWLVKFVGLGRYGTEKFAHARRLADAGFAPAPIRLCHGFVIERWRDDLSPMTRHLDAGLRTNLLARVGDYLAFRAQAFPASNRSGASLYKLHAMARHNTEQALGPDLATRWDGWRSELARLASRVKVVVTDNRMHAWEWLQGAGLILKTDGLDHHAAHDLVGCQDIAWDVAGAAVEFDLSPDEVGALMESMSRRMGQRVDGELLQFLAPCYQAFQLGYYHEAQAASGDAEESARLGAAARRYEQAMRQALESGSFHPR